MSDPERQNKQLVAEAIRLLSDEYESNERFNEYSMVTSTLRSGH